MQDGSIWTYLSMLQSVRRPNQGVRNLYFCKDNTYFTKIINIKRQIQIKKMHGNGI